jgi:Subtilase family
VEKKVHIISMSLGFSRLVHTVEPIRKAILEAYAADVIIFAAAHNDGDLRPIGFPAALDEVICVGSTDGLGNKSPFTPSNLPVGRSVWAVGEGLHCLWPKALDGSNGRTRKSGNSYATPIAAGIAAAILDYMWPAVDENAFYFSKLRTKRGMLSVMQTLTEGNKNRFPALTPWTLFNDLLKAHIRSAITVALESI